MALILHVLDGEEVVGHLDALDKRHEVLVAGPGARVQDLVVRVDVLILVRFDQLVLKARAGVVGVLGDTDLEVG